jgi:hypothetical protein
MNVTTGAIVEKELSDGRWVGVTPLLWGNYLLWVEEHVSLLETGVRDGGFDRGWVYPTREQAAHAFDSYQWYSDKPETGWIKER